MISESDPISLKMKPLLWKIRIVDSILNPKMVRNLHVSGPASVKGAIDKAQHSDGYEEFRAQFPACAIAVVEIAGQIDA